KNHVHNSDIHFVHGGAGNLRYNHDSLSLLIVSSVTGQKVYQPTHHQSLYGKFEQYGRNRNKTWSGLQSSMKDRKSVVEGKSVDLDGERVSEEKNEGVKE